MKLKRCIAIMLAAVILSVVSVSAFALEGISVGYVNHEGTILYNRTFDAMLGRLSMSTPILYIRADENNIVRIVTQSGEMGYIYDGYVTPLANVPSGSVYKTVGADIVVYTTNSKGRVNHAYTISAGLPILVTAVNGEWARVYNLRGQMGYMLTANLIPVC